MTTTTIENTLDSAYFIPSESTGAKFPALQISQYKMLGLNDKLSLVLDPDALELMDLPQSQYM